MRKNYLSCLALLLSIAAQAASSRPAAKPSSPRFEVSFPKEMSATPLDGHILLLISNNDEKEPRFQISFITARIPSKSSASTSTRSRPAIPPSSMHQPSAIPPKASTTSPLATTGCKPSSTFTTPSISPAAAHSSFLPTKAKANTGK